MVINGSSSHIYMNCILMNNLSKYYVHRNLIKYMNNIRAEYIKGTLWLNLIKRKKTQKLSPWKRFRRKHIWTFTSVFRGKNPIRRGSNNIKHSLSYPSNLDSEKRHISNF